MIFGNCWYKMFQAAERRDKVRCDAWLWCVVLCLECHGVEIICNLWAAEFHILVVACLMCAGGADPSQPLGHMCVSAQVLHWSNIGAHTDNWQPRTFSASQYILDCQTVNIHKDKPVLMQHSECKPWELSHQYQCCQLHDNSQRHHWKVQWH